MTCSTRVLARRLLFRSRSRSRPLSRTIVSRHLVMAAASRSPKDVSARSQLRSTSSSRPTSAAACGERKKAMPSARYAAGSTTSIPPSSAARSANQTGSVFLSSARASGDVAARTTVHGMDGKAGAANSRSSGGSARGTNSRVHTCRAPLHKLARSPIAGTSHAASGPSASAHGHCHSASCLGERNLAMASRVEQPSTWARSGASAHSPAAGGKRLNTSFAIRRYSSGRSRCRLAARAARRPRNGSDPRQREASVSTADGRSRADVLALDSDVDLDSDLDLDSVLDLCGALDRERGRERERDLERERDGMRFVARRGDRERERARRRALDELVRRSSRWPELNLAGERGRDAGGERGRDAGGERGRSRLSEERFEADRFMTDWPSYRRMSQAE